MSIEIHRILQSMWHKSRKEFTSWSGSEIDRRANVGEMDRRKATCDGLISAETVERIVIYSITSAGIKEYKALQNA